MLIAGGGLFDSLNVRQRAIRLSAAARLTGGVFEKPESVQRPGFRSRLPGLAPGRAMVSARFLQAPPDVPGTYSGLGLSGGTVRQRGARPLEARVRRLSTTTHTKIWQASTLHVEAVNSFTRIKPYLFDVVLTVSVIPSLSSTVDALAPDAWKASASKASLLASRQL
jgi:hypothetical protein